MHAWAFYASIQRFAALRGVDTGLVLGHVIAHEVGHLLLRNNAHSQTGTHACRIGPIASDSSRGAHVDVYITGGCADSKQAWLVEACDT